MFIRKYLIHKFHIIESSVKQLTTESNDRIKWVSGWEFMHEILIIFYTNQATISF